MGYTTDAVKGVSWVGALRFVTRIISLLRTFILARILLPSQFGAFGIASLFVAFLDVLTETGVNILLIQEKDDIDKYIGSAWIISIGRGIFIATVIFLSSSFVAHFFHTPEAKQLLIWISLVPLIKGFINPSVVKFQRELRFRTEFWYRLFIFTVEVGTTILFALVLHQAISFVIGLIVGAIVEVILSFIFIRPLPQLMFQKEYFMRIVHRGKWITATVIFNYLFQNIDNIIVGRILGSGALGLYQMGYTLSIVPATEISDVFSKVTLPIYARISGEKERLRKAFVKTFFTIATLTIPFGLLLFLFPKEIVLLLLGDKWLELVPALKILAIFGVLRGISGFSATLFLAIGKQEYATITNFVSIFVLSIFIVSFVSLYGISGAALAASLGVIAAIPFITMFTIKTLKDS